MGRRAEALQDAHIAWLILDHQANPDLPPELQTFPVGPAQPSDLFPLILPILKEGQSRDFAPALAAFRALPATDWIALSNRAATMKDIGDIPSAYADSREALRLAPNEPAVLNNLCELFADDGKAKDGMAYCQRAVALAPQMAPVYDSYAAALVGVGRCEDAKAELAKAHRLDPVSVTYQRTLDCKSAK